MPPIAVNTYSPLTGKSLIAHVQNHNRLVLVCMQGACSFWEMSAEIMQKRKIIFDPVPSHTTLTTPPQFWKPHRAQPYERTLPCPIEVPQQARRALRGRIATVAYAHQGGCSTPERGALKLLSLYVTKLSNKNPKPKKKKIESSMACAHPRTFSVLRPTFGTSDHAHKTAFEKLELVEHERSR